MIQLFNKDNNSHSIYNLDSFNSHFNVPATFPTKKPKLYSPQKNIILNTVPATVIPRSGPILGTRSVSESDVAMPWRAIPTLKPFLSGGYGHRPISSKVEAPRNQIRTHPQDGFF